MSCQNKTRRRCEIILFIIVRVLFNYTALDRGFQSTLAKQIM